VHFPSQPVFGGVGLTGTDDSHVGGVPIQAIFAFSPWSMNVTVPPLAIVTDLAGCGFDADPSAVQHGQLLTSQFSLTSSFTSDEAAPASAGTIATAAPSTAATGR
jgi:hypothetical protein